jgi:hypothetical protein
MTPASPATHAVARGLKLAGSLEGRVRSAVMFLSIIEENTPQIFDQFEKILFT